MNVLAPKSWAGFAIRLVFLVALVAAENIIFAQVFARLTAQPTQTVSYYLIHAILVGGPLIAFFLAVTVFQVRLQRRLYQLSRKDGLTGLNNRRTFFELVEKVRAQDKVGVILMLDADRFKKINDTYGHQAGDRCLKSIAHVLRRSLRADDIVARVGGEEFAIYLRNVSVQTAAVIGHRLTTPITFETEQKKSLSVTLSVGAARAVPEATIDALFAQADAALYIVKRDGGAGYRLADADLLAAVGMATA